MTNSFLMVGLEVSRLGYANAKLGGATWFQQLVKSLVLPCYRHPDYVIDFQISLSCTFVITHERYLFEGLERYVHNIWQISRYVHDIQYF